MTQEFIELLGSLAKLIDQYGLSLILLLLLIFWLRPKLDDMWRVVMEGRKIIEPSVNRLMQFDIEAKGILRECLIEFNADWVQLWQFHNGTFGAGKPHLPFLFLSISHSVKSDKVESMDNVFRELPTAFFDFTNIGMLDKDILIHSHELGTEKTNNGEMAKIMKEYNAKIGYLVPIRDEDGELTALMTVGFTTDISISPENQLKVKIYARRLGILMATVKIERYNDKKKGANNKEV